MALLVTAILNLKMNAISPIIGITGGSSIVELGSPYDVNMFFENLKIHVIAKRADLQWAILTDRFYRRYLRPEELPVARRLMQEASIFMEKIWEPTITGVTLKEVPSTEFSMAKYYKKYFDGFLYCADSADLNYASFKDSPNYDYEPVRLICSNLEGIVAERSRTLTEYDALQGNPLWLRKVCAMRFEMC